MLEIFRRRLLEDGYRLLDLIGTGGTAEVFAAERLNDGMPVAVKILWTNLGEAGYGLFEKEVTALKSLRHPNIVQLLGSGEVEIKLASQPSQRLLYLVLERGQESLERFIAKRGEPLPPLDAARIVLKIADATSFAHSITPRILHLDIKPGNILRVGAGWKLTDFNLARFMAAGGWGTQGFRSPQLARSGRLGINEQEDVFGLAATLYQAMTCEYVSQFRINRGLLPRRPERFNKAIPHQLSQVVMAGLHPDRRWRYATPGDFASDLRRCLAGDDISPPPEPRWSRSTRFARWNPVLTAASVAAVSLAFVLTRNNAKIGEQEKMIVAAGKEIKEKTALAGEKAREAEISEQRKLLETYTADMKRAWGAWESNASLELRALLNKYANLNVPGTADPRGFEWYYLDRLANSGIRSLRFGGPVRAVTFSPDSLQIAGLGYQPRKGDFVTLWDVPSGKPERTFSFGETLPARTYGLGIVQAPLCTGTPQTIVYSPDGSLIAATCIFFRDTVRDGVVKIWEVNSGREIFSISDAAICGQAIAFSPDGKVILAGGYEFAVLAWDIASHTLKSTIPAFRPGVNRTPLKTIPRPSPAGSENPVISLQFNEGGTSINRTVGTRVEQSTWPPPDNGPSNHLSRTASAPPRRTSPVGTARDAAQAIDPYAKYQLSGDQSGQVVLRARTSDDASATDETVLRGHSGKVMALAISQNGNYIAATGSRGVTLWKLTNKPPALDAIPKLPRQAQRLETEGNLHPTREGRWFYGVDNGYLLIFDADKPNASPKRFQPQGGLPVAISPDGLLCAMPGRDSTANKVVRKYMVTDRNRAPSFADVAKHSENVPIYIVETLTGRTTKILKGHKRRVTSLMFNQSGTQLLSASLDLTVKLWDIASGQELRSYGSHQTNVENAEFSPDNHWIISRDSSPAAVRIWSPDADDEINHFACDGSAFWAFHGELIAISGQKGKIIIWDLIKRKKVSEVEILEHKIGPFAFMGNGSRLISVIDGTMTFWSCQTGKELFTVPFANPRTIMINVKRLAATLDRLQQQWSTQLAKTVSEVTIDPE